MLTAKADREDVSEASQWVMMLKNLDSAELIARLNVRR